MKVKELIEKLASLDQEATVLIHDEWGVNELNDNDPYELDLFTWKLTYDAGSYATNTSGSIWDTEEHVNSEWFKIQNTRKEFTKTNIKGVVIG